MKHKKRTIVALLAAALVLALAALVWQNLPRRITATDAAFDLSQLTDGRYVGSCDNGPVKVVVAVDVQNHAITGVEILKHDNGRGSAANAITADVVRRQSVEVDTVAGATYSSDTILKAVETALSKGQVEE